MNCLIKQKEIKISNFNFTKKLTWRIHQLFQLEKGVPIYNNTRKYQIVLETLRKIFKL